MAKLIYAAITSLDLYTEDEDGRFNWARPDEELHTLVNEIERPAGTHLYGRRMYETMVYWETAEQQHSLEDFAIEFARIWKAMPKLVFSHTLDSVEGNARLATGDAGEEVAKLKEQPGKNLAVGGAGIASTLIALGLVDEYRLFVSPVVVGGGTPYFPAGVDRIDLELVETRTFGSRVVYLRYARA